MDEQRISFRPEEAERATGICRTKLFELIRTGEIESIKVGRARVIPADSLRAFIERKRTEQVEKRAA